ncbi:putative G-protein coupled receptor, partial [Apostichopus japonicus]
LIEIDEDELGKETQGSSSVIICLEQLVSNVQENPGNFTDVQANVGVQAVKVNPSITNAITFISLSPSNSTHQDVQNADLSEENTILHNDEREIQTDISLTSIFVPSIILELALIAVEGIDSNEVVIEKTCVFWLVQPGRESGSWSDDGCLTSKDNNHTVCTCSHLTNFAVLVRTEAEAPFTDPYQPLRKPVAFYITFLAGDLAKTSPRHCRNIATAIHYF